MVLPARAIVAKVHNVFEQILVGSWDVYTDLTLIISMISVSPRKTK